jgi:hydrogenase nickel incorporation protein HypA/HybF
VKRIEAMNEVVLCQELLQILEERGRSDGFARVHAVWIELGDSVCIEPDSLQRVFEVAKEGTIADDARLTICEGSSELCCTKCGKRFHRIANVAECPYCGAAELLAQGSDQLRIVEVEVT